MDPEAIPRTDVFYPTVEEFEDFQGYVNQIEKLTETGIVKVVPPKGYKATTKNYDQEIANLRVEGPIEQNFNKKSMKGVYELVLIQKKSMKVQDYKKRVIRFDSMTADQPIEKVEKMFWNSLSFNPPVYGADVQGSLFDKGKLWNLAELPGLLQGGLGPIAISGINTPYFYFGSWRTTFAWHCEDLDLPSINFLHCGKPKFWYSVHQDDSEKLEKITRSFFPENFKRCKETMRHKTILINPYLVKKINPDIRIFKQIQNPGEFIITFPHAYHCGFNFGFNVAEAVNFATLGWLTKFTKTQTCFCQSGNVSINAGEFYKNLVYSNPKLKNNSAVKILRNQLLELGQLPEGLDKLTPKKKRKSSQIICGSRKMSSSARKNHLSPRKAKLNKKVISSKKSSRKNSNSQPKKVKRSIRKGSSNSKKSTSSNHNKGNSSPLNHNWKKSQKSFKVNN